MASLAAWLENVRTPWIAVGDFNHTPEEMWASGWPSAMNASIATHESMAPTCYLQGTTPRLIDYALVSHDARLVTSVDSQIWVR